MKASRSLVGFGVLIDNTIKELPCLHEIMSRNSTKKLILNEKAYVLQASVFISLTFCISDKQIEKERFRARDSCLI